jgi:hypothetical protein
MGVLEEAETEVKIIHLGFNQVLQIQVVEEEEVQEGQVNLIHILVVREVQVSLL